MIITIERTRTFIPTWNGNDKLPKEEQISFDYNVMTGEQFEKFLSDLRESRISDADLFTQQVTAVHNLKVIDEKGKEKTISNPKEVIALQGTFRLYDEVVADIIRSSQLSEEEKNA